MPAEGPKVAPAPLDLRPRIPLAACRLQSNRQFTFEDATGLLFDLDALGVSDLHASPCFAARHGSLHGYDIVAVADRLADFPVALLERKE